MISFEEAPDSFLASMVDHVKCYPDRTLEVALNILPTRWKYMLSRYIYSDKKEEQGPVSEPEPALLNNNVHRIASGPLFSLYHLAIFGFITKARRLLTQQLQPLQVASL